MSVCPEACRGKGLRQRYDALGRVTTLTHTIVGLTPMVTFTQAYDAAGRRTRLNARSWPRRRSTAVPPPQPVLGEKKLDIPAANLVQWVLTDHLNTVRDIAQFDPETGATIVVNHLVYDAFGRVTAESNAAVDSLFLFTARPFDEDTQLQNNLNRWYDAAVGRWPSEDPIGFDGGDSNLSRYARNNVVIHVDASGLRICTLTTSPIVRYGPLLPPKATAGGFGIGVSPNPSTVGGALANWIHCRSERLVHVQYSPFQQYYNTAIDSK